MILPRILLAVALLAAAGRVGADGTRLVHTPPPPVTLGERVEIAFTLVGDERAASADLFVRPAGGSSYEKIPAEERKGVFRVSVPARYIAAPGFEYYLIARAESGGEATSPARAPDANPHRVPVSSRGAVERIVIFSPEEGEVIADSGSFSLSVLFDPPLEPGDSAFFTLDGEPAAGRTERTPDYLSVRPSPAPAPGAHEAAAIVVSASGERGERRWSFVLGKGTARTLPFALAGRIEAGWALVENGEVEGDAVPFYDETSSLVYDAYASGAGGGRTFSFSSSRDPIYDDEIRFSGRWTSDRFTLEAGDVYPALSELTVSWLSGKGALAEARLGEIENTLFLVRSLPSDTSGGIGTYSEFVAGEKLSYEKGRWDASLQTSYGWENESSVPESLRLLPAVRNLVVSGGFGFRLDEERRIHVESGRSDTRGDDTTSGNALRVVATLLDKPERSLSVEYHDYRPGFFALASPTVDEGERGFLVDAAVRAGGFFRQSFKAESYSDAESVQDLDDDARSLQLYGRTDFDWKLRGIDWNAYALVRHYEIPFAVDPYRSRYGTIGLLAGRPPHALSLSGTATETRASSRTKGWTANGSWSGSAREGLFSWRVGERYARSETVGDTTGIGESIVLSRAERWSLLLEAAVPAGGLEWRSSYERIDEDDPVEAERFTQHVFLLVAGRRF